MRAASAKAFQTRSTPELAQLHRRAGHRVSRHRDARRRALHPASRRAEGVHQGDRRATRLGFADYRGNRQYITLANLSENDRAICSCSIRRASSASSSWGRAAHRRGRCRAGRETVRRRLQGATRARDPVRHRSLGRELLVSTSSRASPRPQLDDAFASCNATSPSSKLTNARLARTDSATKLAAAQ